MGYKMKKSESNPIKIIFVELELAWLEAYKAWLQLDPVYRQMYPCPKRPIWLDGKIIIQKEEEFKIK